MKPLVATEPVSKDAADPAIWINRKYPSQSLIVGTNKAAAPTGSLVVYDLNGKIEQTVAGLDRPNNVDIQSGLRVGGRLVGPTEGYLWEYLLTDDGHGRVMGTKVRSFGRFGGNGEIETVAVDDELGYVYYADEDTCIRKHWADPDHSGADKELVAFATKGYEGDREGVSIYETQKGKGYIVSADQRRGESLFYLYPREGEPGRPHDHTREVAVLRGGADDTDGIESTSTPLGPHYPHGMLVAMNSKGHNFFYYPWNLRL